MKTLCGVLVFGTCSTLAPRTSVAEESSGVFLKATGGFSRGETSVALRTNARNLAALGAFCRRMGRDAKQGEIGLVVGDEYFAIREFEEE